MRDKAACDRSQAVQTRNPVDQLRGARAEVPLDQHQAMLEQRRHGEKQRRQPRIGIELEPGDNQRHPQRMPPDVLPTAEAAIAISRAGKVHCQADAIDLGYRETFTKRQQGLFAVALRGDRMNDRYHWAIIRSRQRIRHNATFLSSCR
jgi:hypothetical protein